MKDASYERSVLVRLKLDGRQPVDCKLWQLSDPQPSDDGTTRTDSILDFVGSPLVAFDHAIRVAVVLEGAELLQGLEMYEPELEVVAQSEPGFGVCSLHLRGNPEQLWRLTYLLRMASSSGSMSAAFLKDDVQRWAWIRAALYFSGAITPWIQLGDLDQDFSVKRPIPDQISVVVDPELFESRATFFSLMGERLLGPAGYGGQDLQGFAEIVRLVAHLVQKLEVNFVDPEACALAASHFETQDQGFFQHVHEILSQAAHVVETRSASPGA